MVKKLISVFSLLAQFSVDVYALCFPCLTSVIADT